jgi:hypothetical protein
VLLKDSDAEAEAVAVDNKTLEPKLTLNAPLSSMVVPLEIKGIIKSPLI